MKVYRVYKHYHSSSESGTIEYGIFTTKDKVKEVLKKLYKKEKKNKANIKVVLHLEKMYIEMFGIGWGYHSIRTKKYELNKEIAKRIIGFT